MSSGGQKQGRASILAPGVASLPCAAFTGRVVKLDAAERAPSLPVVPVHVACQLRQAP